MTTLGTDTEHGGGRTPAEALLSHQRPAVTTPLRKHTLGLGAVCPPAQGPAHGPRSFHGEENPHSYNFQSYYRLTC